MRSRTQRNRARIKPNFVLETARRHVLEGEKRVAGQEALVEWLRSSGREVSTAEFQLKVFKKTLQTMRDHLEFEEQEVQRKRN